MAPCLMLLTLFSVALLFLSTSSFHQGNLENPLLRIANKNLAHTASLRDQLNHLFTPHQHLDRGTIYWPFLYDNHQVMTGEFIALNYPKNIRVVYDQMGQTPWYAGLDKHFIDSIGLIDKPVGAYLFNRKVKNSKFLAFFTTLTSPVIELFGGEKRGDWTREKALQYIFDQEPEVIMLHAMVARNSKTVPGMLMADKRLEQFYEYKYSVNVTQVYERKGINWDRGEIQFPKNCDCNTINEKK